jgi:RNA polymerase sigma-70 factor, ECF subfamily
MDAAAWQAHRRYLFAVAYRLPGSVSEDAVQETYPAAAPRTAELANPRARLTPVVARVCWTCWARPGTTGEPCVATWLPEPLVGYYDSDLGL